MHYISFLIISLLFYCSSLIAQDARFSQFYAAPHQLNPAFAATFEGSMRFQVNYRDQWSSLVGNSSFRTYVVGADWKQAIASGDEWSLGVHALRDDRVGSGDWTRQQGFLNAAYVKTLSRGYYEDEGQYVTVGAQLGAGQQEVDGAALWFSQQYDQEIGRPNRGLDNGEGGLVDGRLQSDLYLDFNAGLMWYGLWGDGWSTYAGAALYHLNQPNTAVLPGVNESLARRWSLQVGAEMPLNKILSLLPSIAWMRQQEMHSLMMGGQLRYSHFDWRELAMRIGLWWHRSARLEEEQRADAMVVSALLEWERWQLGISYDVNVSELQVASDSRGAFELSMQYRLASKERYSVRCPRM